MRNHYFKTKVVKMGQWATTILDMETWYGQETNYYFKKLFGIPKGLLKLYDDTTGYSHNYVPEDYFILLHKQIKKIKSTNYRGLEIKLKTFYGLDKKAKKEVGKVYKYSTKLTNKQLNIAFLKIRHWIHHLAIFDQFGWLAEEGFMPQMENILVNKLKIKKDSPEYQRVLFALTAPENISTTLRERLAVLEQAIKIGRQKQTLAEAGKILARDFGWLPIFCYGEPWPATHYLDEVKKLAKKDVSALEKECQKLKDHSFRRNRDITEISKKYKIGKRDLQIFIDFGLATDTRNEAEYFVSFGGYFLMPLYKEIAKKLFISVKQLRDFTEEEVSDALLGKVTAESILAKKSKYSGFGYDKKMQKRIDFAPAEAEKLFKYIESYVKPIQGGDENRGTCASPGVAKGKIRIVPYPKDNHKVKQGDILVTYATTTDYLPAMKRAAAIITEVGGLTCHAAVVSREFGIPCIVALKNAMKNFKDGQMVEVDANKGIVKKVNK
jgi:phosphoenolpyruvate synthase/pyruvate phosphate dikinase